ncbi:amidase [Arthrobacter sp. V4I6]|uniref:amidase n=1 Tax=unclassified Arthrobacter TaxID=235627 RepID=UPI0027858695|nr:MULTISPECIES: amidase [unclassified Arthrobacter]MDQ0823209.1 amidase [Arthrobacter sp. V1I7]MDQ0852839.1 amidase [Arthrobacter sp. V4I6]
MADLHELSAVQLRDALHTGTVSAREAAGHFLNRIGTENAHLGAFITVTAEQALKDAAAADELHSRATKDGTGLPLLHGMPVAFKDLTDVAGVVTTHGSAALDHKPALADAAITSALKGAGIISLGKTQVPEFGLTAYSENRIAPPSRNPHALSRSSGGSSGGSAAAVAAGLLPFAPGSDGGGSVRIPAAACGLVGLKPGRGLVPAGESSGDPARLVVTGPLARTAADAALMLDALVPSEPRQSGTPAPGYLALTGREPRKLRIGVSLDSPWQLIFPFVPDQEALDALAAGIGMLEAAGHETAEASIRYDNRYPDAFTTAWTAAVGSARIAPQREALLTPLTRTFRRRAQQRSAAKLNESLGFLRLFQRDTIAQYAAWDLILMPALAQTPRPVGWFTGSAHGDGYWPAAEWAGDADGDYRKQCEFAPWSSMVNVCGLPAISIPVHWTGDRKRAGLPMGIQLVGPMGSEALLLQLAAQLGH